MTLKLILITVNNNTKKPQRRQAILTAQGEKKVESGRVAGGLRRKWSVGSG